MFSLTEKIRGDRKGWYKVSDLVAGMEIAVPTEAAIALNSFGEDDILWDEIVSIKHVGHEQVWDIEVEGTHNFVGNDIFAHNTYLLRADPFTDTVSIGSNLGIGLASGSTAMEKLEVAGNVLARAFITDNTADVAENYATADSSINAGDVVQLDSAGNLVKSNKAYAPVLGVISTAPGLLLDGKSVIGKAPLTLTGRVPVKVNLENGPIKIGDRLTSSSTPGVAMKATNAGETLGMALEPLDSVASGSYQKKSVFINLGWQAGTLATDGTLTATSDMGQTTSGSQNLPTSQVGSSAIVDVLATIANSVMVKFQNIWASGDVIAQGVRKTYYAFADMTIFKDLNITNWGSRTITIDNSAPDTAKSLFQGNGAQAAEQSKIDLKEESNGSYLATYGVDSTRGEIQLSGSSDLVNGEARIFFDYSFSSIISGAVSLRVMVTPTTPIQGQLYVATKTQYGFVVKELNSTDVGKFDWLVIARRKGYENGEGISPSPSTSPLPSATPVVSPSDTPVPSDTPSESPVSTPPIDTPLPSDTPIPSVTPSATPVLPVPSPEPSILDLPTASPDAGQIGTTPSDTLPIP